MGSFDVLSFHDDFGYVAQRDGLDQGFVMNPGYMFYRNTEGTRQLVADVIALWQERRKEPVLEPYL